jgi:hypothetical protein
MADVRDLIPREQQEHRQILGNWYALFAYDVAQVNDPAYVVIPDIDANSVWGPCYWQPQLINTLQDTGPPGTPEYHMIPFIIKPLAGDEALVTFDNRKSTWIVCWWPRVWPT